MEEYEGEWKNGKQDGLYWKKLKLEFGLKLFFFYFFFSG